MNRFNPTANLPDVPKLDIDAPPCVHCKFWNPQPEASKGTTGFVYYSVKLCHAEMMHKDFSCFRARS